MAAFAVLTTRADFDKVFKAHQHKIFMSGFLLFARANRLGYPRLGMVIAKKSVKLAVRRNAIKRRLRESFRLLVCPHAAALDCVVVVNKQANGLQLTEITRISSLLFSRLMEQQ